MPRNTLKTSSLNLTSLSNVGGNFTATWNGKTSLQPIGTVTGLVTLQYSNDNVNFFDLADYIGINVNTPIVLDSADWAFYRFKVDTVGTGAVTWSVAGSEIPNTVINVSGGGGGSGSGVTTFNTRSGNVTADTNDYNATQIENTPSGDITATNVQSAIYQLDSKIDENIGIITGQKAFLTSTQANTTNVLAVLNGATFEIPPLKTAKIQSIIIFTAVATTTGITHGIRVTNPLGATADVIGRTYSGVNISSNATATALNDGDNYIVSANSNVVKTITGTASTAGNVATIRFADIYNPSTTTSATVTVEFASEVNGSAVTAQIGSGATCIIF